MPSQSVLTVQEPAPSPRDRILRTAHDLFYRQGVRATGVDRIIAEADVAKLTFYRHFASKDDLVEAFLHHRHERWMAWFVDALGRHGATAGGGLSPLPDALGEWFHEPLFRGCAFINAVAELGAGQPAVGDIALRHKLEMQQVIEALLPPGPVQRALASAAAMAVDGAIVRAQMADGAEGDRQKKSALGDLRRVLIALDAASRGDSQESCLAAGAVSATG
ncbi:MAG: TetR/AcrR family transcriptional regulator [Polaromonas sp.]|nr:TetR/AcrR family transcriptional regulator [Polaromonas sp.]